MASEAVKKILAAESGAGQRISEAKKRKEEIINDAQGRSVLTIQKKLGDAAAESARIKSGYDERLKKYNNKVEEECRQMTDELRRTAEQNMDKAVDAVISRFF